MKEVHLPHTTDFDWQPYEPEEPPDTAKTAYQKRKWLADRPYRLFLCVLDFDKGTYIAASDRSGSKPRSKLMFKPHWCYRKEEKLWH